MADADAGWRTWANLVTLVRLGMVPVFLWLLFGTGHRAVAAWLLGVLGATDWVDGFLARRLHQVSNLGKVLDPVADRVLVVTGLVAVAAAGAVPWWFAGLTLAREVIVSGRDARAGRAGGRAHRRALVGQGLDLRADDDLPALPAREQRPPRPGGLAARRPRRRLGDRGARASRWRGWSWRATCARLARRCGRAAPRGPRTRVGAC